MEEHQKMYMNEGIQQFYLCSINIKVKEQKQTQWGHGGNKYFNAKEMEYMVRYMHLWYKGRSNIENNKAMFILFLSTLFTMYHLHHWFSKANTKGVNGLGWVGF